MHIDYLLEVFRASSGKGAVVWNDRVYSYEWLEDAVARWGASLRSQSIQPGAVVGLAADYSPNAIAVLLALIDNACTVVPLTAVPTFRKSTFQDIAQIETMIEVDARDEVHIAHTGVRASHPLLLRLRAAVHPGLVLFSSGSTGASKAALHDFVPLLEKFKAPRRSLRIVMFLLFDHIGGLNTLLYSLSNSGCAILLEDRSADSVCRAIMRHKAQLLPASPTFLNLLLVSGAHARYDLSSLETVTYGTEVMPLSTLGRLQEAFPQVRIQQTYGLSELGILRSKSMSSDSVWVKIGGEGFESRVVEGMLEIKARSAMLGYLNAPSPFTADGWFKTGDAIEVRGEFIRILGRKSELINVGGEKVYPAEVESVIHAMPGVEDVAVVGAAHPIVGQIVTVRVKLNTGENVKDFRKRMWEHCADKLQRYKIPQKVLVVADNLHGDRFKKLRAFHDER